MLRLGGIHTPTLSTDPEHGLHLEVCTEAGANLAYFIVVMVEQETVYEPQNSTAIIAAAGV